MAKIGVLDFSGLQKECSDSKYLSPVRDFYSSIKRKGFVPAIYKAEKCQMAFLDNKLSVFYGDKTVKKPDVLLPLFYYMGNLDLDSSIIKQFQLFGVNVVNGYLPTVFSQNRMRAYQILSDNGIPIVKSVIVKNFAFLDNAVKEIGGFPIVVKSAHGVRGSSVLLLESQRAFMSILDIMLKRVVVKSVLLQKYVDSDDYQIMVVGGEVIASMKREVVGDEFRSSLDFDGVGVKVKVSDEFKKLAVDAARVLGVDVCSVGILKDVDGPVVLDVNVNPDFLYMAKITGVDIVGKVVDYMGSLINK